MADYLAGQGSLYLLQVRNSQAELPTTPCYLNIGPPYELLLQRHASIVGPHSGGKFVLALRELPGCTLSELTRIAYGQDHLARQKLCQLAVATKNCIQAMVVEYIAAAEDGWGRVYARQACAQQLPRAVRTLVYGSTHKEVDMSGAHYEIVRRLVNSSTLPPISVLREQLLRLDQQERVNKANELYHITCELIVLCQENQILWSCENPYHLCGKLPPFNVCFPPLGACPLKCTIVCSGRRKVTRLIHNIQSFHQLHQM